MPANFSFNTDLLWGFLLTLTRAGSALLFLPMPGFPNMLQPARIILIVSSTICLFPVWATVAQTDRSLDMASAILVETSIGLIIGLTTAFLFESLQLGAQAIAYQTGFGFASTIDPQSQADSNILQIFCQLTSGLIFFALGIHVQVFRMLSLSFTAFSLDQPHASESSVALLLRLGTRMFGTGVRISLPVVVLLFLVDQALSALTRLQSQLQLMTLAFPAKIVLSLIFLAAILVRWSATFEQIAAQMFGQLFHLLSV